MSGHDIIVVGASAGGVEALNQLVSALPPDLPAAIFIVLHIPSHGTSVLPSILNRSLKKHQPNSLLQAVHPQDGENIEYRRIYIAPPDHHLLVKNGYIGLARGPRENGHRPAVDPLFRSAARYYGRRVVGVVLSGTLDDGTAGLLAVKQQGGVAIVQDPEDALYSSMPQSAIENVEVDQILPVCDIAPLLLELAYQAIEESEVQPVSENLEIESDMAELELGAMQKADRPGTPSPYACPDCNGVLWEVEEDKLLRFRCRTGHAFSVGSLLAKQSEGLEEALWNALRALEEKAALTQRMAKRAGELNQKISAQRFAEQAEVAHQRATLIRQMLLNGDGNNGKGNNIGLSTVNGKVVGLQESSRAGEQRSRGAAQSLSGGSLRLELSKREEQGSSGAGENVSPDGVSELTGLKVVVICTSGDQLNAISHLLSALRADFPAAIIIVPQLYADGSSRIVDFLNQRTQLLVKQAEQGERLHSETVYVAPVNWHLLVNPDSTISLLHSELVHFVRPSANLLLESVAASFKQQAIALILTDTGSDVAMGVQAIKQMNGTVIAQAQTTSESLDLPEAAINNSLIDLVVPLDEIAATLMNLIKKKDESFRRT